MRAELITANAATMSRSARREAQIKYPTEHKNNAIGTAIQLAEFGHRPQFSTIAPYENPDTMQKATQQIPTFTQLSFALCIRLPHRLDQLLSSVT